MPNVCAYFCMSCKYFTISTHISQAEGICWNPTDGLCRARRYQISGLAVEQILSGHLSDRAEILEKSDCGGKDYVLNFFNVFISFLERETERVGEGQRERGRHRM